MRRRSRVSRKPVKTRRRKARRRSAALRRRQRDDPVPPLPHRKPRSRGVKRELHEAREQQTATADVLRVISASRGDLQPVFEAMVEKARRLCEADAGHLALRLVSISKRVRSARCRAEMEALIRSMSYAPGRGTAVGRALAERHPVQISDIGADNEHIARQPAGKGFIRTILGVPLLPRGRSDRRIRALASARRAIHRTADRPGAELRRPGRYRHRERAAAQRIAAIAGATDRDCRRTKGHLKFAGRIAAGVRGHAGERHANLPSRIWHAEISMTEAPSAMLPCIIHRPNSQAAWRDHPPPQGKWPRAGRPDQTDCAHRRPSSRSTLPGWG